MSKFVAFPRMKSFNREDSFIFRRKMKVVGTWYKEKDPVPKEHFTTRRLRQLFEQRFIESIGMPLVADDSSERTRPMFKQLPTAAIKDFLKTNGVVPRTGWMRDKLITRAEELWDQVNGVTS